VKLPGDAVAWLSERLRCIEADVLEPRGLSATGLSQREIDILGMLADRLETSEIARRMCYSERTIKNSIYAMLTRLRLRNRTQAVAFAIRNNAL
jgi:DNA-binding NarL/FixJ family response regulator